MAERLDTESTAGRPAAASSSRWSFLARRRRHRAEQRYWDHFINAAARDPLNQLIVGMRAAPEGTINSVRAEVHSPEIMSDHVKEIAKKFGCDLVGVVALDEAHERPPQAPEEAQFAVVCVVLAENDPSTSPGIGGQVPVQNGFLVSFVLGAYFRESGYFATLRTAPASELAELAARAGLGTVGPDGRLRTARHSTNVWVADVIYTDFPLAAEH